MQGYAKETVHGALLNLRPCLPARDRRFAHAQQIRELLLGQPQLVAALTNLRRRQQSGPAPKGGADLLVGVVVMAIQLPNAARNPCCWARRTTSSMGMP
jgi:hypothetical protein